MNGNERQLTLLSVLVLIGCDRSINADAAFKNNVSNYSQQLRQIIPDESVILALCGPSEGKGFYLADGERRWIDETISEGQLALVQLPTRDLDMYFRGADQVLYSAVKDGGKLFYSRPPISDGELQVIVSYPETGVTETHNFTDDQGNQVDLWTTNKNLPGLAGDEVGAIRKVAAFRSECVKGPIS